MEQKNEAKIGNWVRRWYASVVALILVVAVLATGGMAWRADREMRDHLLGEARLVAPAINIARVGTLTGTGVDIDSPDYQRLKEQLSFVRSADERFRFIYLLGRQKSGEVFFFVDNEPSDSKDYSPPGQIYDNASPELRRVFDTKLPIVEGPAADDWGVWVSAQVPLIDHATGAVVAVLGMDIDARDWKRQVIAQAAVPTVLSLLFLLLLLAWVSGARTAAALRENEKRLTTFFQNDLFGKIIVHRTSRKIHDINDSALKLIGLPRDKVVGNICHQFVCPAEHGRCPVCDLKQTVDNSERVLIVADGRRIPILKTVTPIVIEGDDYLLESFIDISDRKKIEDALKESEEKNRLLIDHSISAIATHEIVLDDAGRPVDYTFLSANNAFEKQTGLKVIDIIGRRATAVLPGLEKTRFIDIYGEVALTGKAVSFEQYSEPLKRYFFINAYRIGERRFATVFTDITARRKAEEEARLATERQTTLVNRLESQKIRSDILTELRQFLQATATVAETGSIVEKIMLRLFPASNGALYLMSASRTDLEEVARWGRHHDAPENVPILPDECWGIRRGSFYLVDDPKSALLCRHIVCREPGRYACLPLMAHGEVLGLLHICETPCRPEGERFFESLQEVIGDIAEILSLSIANIKLRETLMIQSIKDPLTGLFNRRYLEETFIRETSRARRKKYPIGVIMTDIDHFKKFNDTHGHAAGDAVLTEIARLLGTSLRTADIVCRYGGEEFVLVLPEASLDDTVRRADDICRKARDLRVPFGDKMLGPVTLSMGVAGYPLHGELLESVLKLADMALYRAKKEGRDRVVIAEVS